MPCLAVCKGGGGWDGPVVCEGLVIVVDQKDVFWLKIGVDQVQVVEECYTGEELLGELLDVGAWERHKGI